MFDLKFEIHIGLYLQVHINRQTKTKARSTVHVQTYQRIKTKHIHISQVASFCPIVMSALSCESRRVAAGPTGCLSSVPGVEYIQLHPGDSRSLALNVVAPGGLAIGGLPISTAAMSSTFATTTISNDVTLSAGDTGTVCVVDLSASGSSTFTVTLPAAADLVGGTFKFVVRAGARGVSFVLRDSSSMHIRQFQPPQFFNGNFNTGIRQGSASSLTLPLGYAFFDPNGHIAVYSPIPITLSWIQSGPPSLLQSLTDGVLYADPTAQTVVVNSGGGQLNSSGFRVSLAQSCDTINVWAAAPDLVIAECVIASPISELS